MANIYLKLLQDARKLPQSYRAMGTTSQNFVDTRSGTAVTGWIVRQVLYKMNEDGENWWSRPQSIRR
jgi:hypothetical protein